MYKLLILEDEELVRKGIRCFVPFDELHISEIYEAGDGEEGLRLFHSYQPDLVLLDINMPLMNGLDFARQAKQIKPHVKIAILTGYDYYDYAVAALKLGVDDYVLKPVSRKDVTEVLGKLVHKLKEDLRQAEVYEILQTYRSKSKPDDAGQKGAISRLIDVHLSNPQFSLGMLANEMGFSTGHMSSLFKRLLGVTFQDYVVSLRLERGKLLLLTTDLKIYEISEQVGFENSNYFSAAFKKKLGVSPLQYRERINE